MLAHHRLGDFRRDPVATLEFVIGTPGFVETCIVFRVDDIYVFSIHQTQAELLQTHLDDRGPAYQSGVGDLLLDHRLGSTQHALVFARSDESRVGKECVSTCRSRGWRYNKIKKNQNK